MTHARRLAGVVLVLVLATPALGEGPILPDGQGGGAYRIVETLPHLTEEQRAAIRAQIEKNREALRSEGMLPVTPLATHVLFGWPLRAANDLIDPGFHGISNFVDQNVAYPNYLLDYQCGSRTYDLSSGYNHAGTDFFTWPFPWAKMDAGKVVVVAAAPGVLVHKQDGFPDRSCGLGGGDWNAVYVEHADGSIAWYGHLKKDSVTTRPIGSSVAEGEYLGVVGSSGNSTGPHLHLEVYDAADRLIDPWLGPCNGLSPDTWWQAQRSYYDSAVNEMTTGPLAPVFPSCPNPESANEQGRFNVGATVYFTTYYRDQRNTQQSVYTIRRPDGSVYSTWTHFSDAPHYAASYWYWWFSNFAPTGPSGLWTFAVAFEGTTTVRTFVIGGSPAGRVRGDLFPEAPLTVSRGTGDTLVLAWPPSCMATDTDYEVYQGTLGSFTSHAAVTCSTGGARTWTLSPSAGSAYYLVVPRNATREGSYGLTGSGAERPAASPVCLPREIGACL